MTKKERETWDAHVDETIATIRELVGPEWEEMQERRRQGLPIGRARWLAERSAGDAGADEARQAS